jgi:hypothetical protein
MSTYIGTNFSYKAEDFLDGRQGIAKSKEELKNWTTPVPKSFEICLSGTWYYYDSEKNLDDTGHWIPRVTESLEDTTDDSRAVSVAALRDLSDQVGVDINALKDYVKSTENTVHPSSISGLVAGSAYTDAATAETDRQNTVDKAAFDVESKIYDENLDIDSDGTLDKTDIDKWNELYKLVAANLPYNTSGTGSTYWQEIGGYVLPKISWKVVKPLVTWTLSGSSVIWSVIKGTENNKSDVIKSTVEGPTKGVISSDFLSWMSKEIIHSTTRASYTYDVTSWIDDVNKVSGSVTFKFAYKYYAGTGDLSFGEKKLITQNDLTGFSNSFTESGGLSDTAFDCSGGKYPYILIPKELYNSSYKTYVSKNLNSDFVISDVTLENNRGIILDYKLFRTTYIQTGNPINIEIK